MTMKTRQTIRIMLVVAAVAIAGVGISNAAGDETPRSPQRAVKIFRFTSSAEARAVCGAQERQCRIGQYITWCCRADQICDTSYAGGCR